MALQNYKERVIYPSILLTATPSQMGMLVMGMDVQLELERKTLLDDGVVIYRNGMLYRCIGNSDEIVCDGYFDEDIPLDLSRFISKAKSLNLSVNLEKY